MNSIKKILVDKDTWHHTWTLHPGLVSASGSGLFVPHPCE